MTTYTLHSLTSDLTTRWPDLKPGTPSLGGPIKLCMTTKERNWFTAMQRRQKSVWRPEGEGVELRIED